MKKYIIAFCFLLPPILGQAQVIIPDNYNSLSKVDRVNTKAIEKFEVELEHRKFFAGQLLKKVVSDSSNYSEIASIPAKLTLLIKWVKWDSASLRYDPGLKALSSKERELKLNREHEYLFMNIYSYPVADTLFTEEDRRDIINQFGLQARFPISKIAIPKIDYIDMNTSPDLGIHYGYSMPLFSKNYEYAVIRKYNYISWNGEFYDYSAQNLYYVHWQNDWVKIFQSDLAN